LKAARPQVVSSTAPNPDNGMRLGPHGVRLRSHASAHLALIFCSSPCTCGCSGERVILATSDGGATTVKAVPQQAGTASSPIQFERTDVGIVQDAGGNIVGHVHIVSSVLLPYANPLSLIGACCACGCVGLPGHMDVLNESHDSSADCWGKSTHLWQQLATGLPCCRALCLDRYAKQPLSVNTGLAFASLSSGGLYP